MPLSLPTSLSFQAVRVGQALRALYTEQAEPAALAAQSVPLELAALAARLVSVLPLVLAEPAAVRSAVAAQQPELVRFVLAAQARFVPAAQAERETAPAQQFQRAASEARAVWAEMFGQALAAERFHKPLL